MTRFTNLFLAATAGFQLASAAPTATTNTLEKRDPPGIRGSSDLLGYSPDNEVVNEDTNSFDYTLADGQDGDENLGQYLDMTDIERPQPIRGSLGGTEAGPYQRLLNELYPDKLAPPGTDNGQTINAQWAMSQSRSKLGLDRAGFSREQNVVVLPDAEDFAGVQMRLEEGAYRELHWHVAAEWALMLNGSVRIQAVNDEGKSFVDDVSKGDVWFFPAGIPHSIQALEGGAEFLLVFDDGEFSEDNTFLVSEVFAHNPETVIAQDFGITTDELANIPDGELFIFPGTAAPADIQEQTVQNSNGMLEGNETYSYHFSLQEPLSVPGGSVKILDPLTFPIAEKFSVALVTIEPGAMREIHWHPTSDEWTFFLYGRSRATLFQASDTATTFDYGPGDVGYFPQSASHYVQNVGDEDVVILEVLSADHFSDVALGQWIGTTPPQIIQDTLNLNQSTVQQMGNAKEKQYVVPADGPVPEPIASKKKKMLRA